MLLYIIAPNFYFLFVIMAPSCASLAAKYGRIGLSTGERTVCGHGPSNCNSNYPPYCATIDSTKYSRLNVNGMTGYRLGSTITFFLISIAINTSNGAPLNSPGTTVLPLMGEPCHVTNACAGDLVCSNTEDGAICIPPEKNDKCSANWECVGMHLKCRDGICRSAQPGDMCGGGGMNCNPDMTCNEHICTVNYAGAACTEDQQCTGSLVCSGTPGTCSKKPIGFAAISLLLLSIIALGAVYAVVYSRIEDDYITAKALQNEGETQEEDETKQDININGDKKIDNETVTPAPVPPSPNSPIWQFRIRSNANDEGGSNGIGNRENNSNRIARIFHRNSSYQATSPLENSADANPQPFW